MHVTLSAPEIYFLFPMQSFPEFSHHDAALWKTLSLLSVWDGKKKRMLKDYRNEANAENDARTFLLVLSVCKYGIMRAKIS